ncbi:MAG: hypothetical protein Q4A11_02215 [Brachymonas sp.]|nr:hypothetical protein [Brachymonas sp.]
MPLTDHGQAQGKKNLSHNRANGADEPGKQRGRGSSNGTTNGHHFLLNADSVMKKAASVALKVT